MAASTPICDFGLKAPDFRLPATDGRTYGLAEHQRSAWHARHVHLAIIAPMCRPSSTA